MDLRLLWQAFHVGMAKRHEHAESFFFVALYWVCAPLNMDHIGVFSYKNEY